LLNAEKQRGKGTRHYVKDLPSNFFGWNAKILDERRERYKGGDE